jgi:hypothetical protein
VPQAWPISSQKNSIPSTDLAKTANHRERRRHDGTGDCGLTGMVRDRIVPDGERTGMSR